MAMYSGLTNLLRGLATFLPSEGNVYAERLVELGRVAVFRAAILDHNERERTASGGQRPDIEGWPEKPNALSRAEKVVLSLFFDGEGEMICEAEACALVAHTVWRPALSVALEEAQRKYFELRHVT